MQSYFLLLMCLQSHYNHATELYEPTKEEQEDRMGRKNEWNHTNDMSVVFCIHKLCHPLRNDPDNFLHLSKQLIITELHQVAYLPYFYTIEHGKATQYDIILFSLN